MGTHLTIEWLNQNGTCLRNVAWSIVSTITEHVDHGRKEQIMKSTRNSGPLASLHSVIADLAYFAKLSKNVNMMSFRRNDTMD
jgi:hypothetical protein